MSELDNPPVRLDLESHAADLVKRLGATWSPNGTMCLCPAHDDRRPSLSIRVGEKALLFKCFAGCDTIDVIRAIRRIDKGIPLNARQDVAQTVIALSPNWLRQRALDLWDDAHPITGTPCQFYLERRSITMMPSALRYHPRTPLGRGRLAVPARADRGSP